MQQEASAPTAPTARIAGLDGLRAVAVSLVILWHVASVLNFTGPMLGPLRAITHTGWAGVDLFFVLSGYLITSLLLREESRDPRGRFSMPRFYLRRALRILPAFAVVMALNYAVLWRAPVFRSVSVGRVLAAGDWLQLAAHALFFGNYWGPYAHLLYQPTSYVGVAVGVTWSLCVEEHFYLLWPLVLRALPRRRLAVGLAACALAPLARHVVSVGGLDNSIALHLASHYRMDSILWGGVLALYASSRAMPGALARRGGLALLGAAVALFVATGDLAPIPRTTPLGHSLGFTLLAMLSALLIAEVVAAQGTWLVRALEARPLRALGERSYGVYLVHFWAIDLARYALIRLRVPPSPSAFLFAFTLALLVSAAIAAALYRLVERPFLALKDRLHAVR